MARIKDTTRKPAIQPTASPEPAPPPDTVDEGLESSGSSYRPDPDDDSASDTAPKKVATRASSKKDRTMKNVAKETRSKAPRTRKSGVDDDEPHETASKRTRQASSKSNSKSPIVLSSDDDLSSAEDYEFPDQSEPSGRSQKEKSVPGGRTPSKDAPSPGPGRPNPLLHGRPRPSRVGEASQVPSHHSGPRRGTSGEAGSGEDNIEHPPRQAGTAPSDEPEQTSLVQHQTGEAAQSGAEPSAEDEEVSVPARKKAFSKTSMFAGSMAKWDAQKKAEDTLASPTTVDASILRPPPAQENATQPMDRQPIEPGQARSTGSPGIGDGPAQETQPSPRPGERKVALSLPQNTVSPTMPDSMAPDSLSEDHEAKDMFAKILELAKEDTQWLNTVKPGDYDFADEESKDAAVQHRYGDARDLLATCFRLLRDDVPVREVEQLSYFDTIKTRFVGQLGRIQDGEGSATGDLQHDDEVYTPCERWSTYFENLSRFDPENWVSREPHGANERHKLWQLVIHRTPHLLQHRSWVLLLVLTLAPKVALLSEMNRLGMRVDEDWYEDAISDLLKEFRKACRDREYTTAKVVRLFDAVSSRFHEAECRSLGQGGTAGRKRKADRDRTGVIEGEEEREAKKAKIEEAPKDDGGGGNGVEGAGSS
ncbi:hypothetical protein BU26DRAFT_524068 [Trematosphaeria pertusa]|uniref:Uncharacterized protein n=1 Tax=Trematosphaeria pertusa TaxID=390896 RepID=A0A6A6HZP8_9PLEO|nr:uncharacterized protein BU26DRAFT_524068 [Trematosphaeria pertusa]KAF2243103.1 hypothetical protein BU26DRAFT_524068 [Trematosphaeria pertusa]